MNGNIKEIDHILVIQKRDEVAHAADKSNSLRGFAAKASVEQIHAFIRRNICLYVKRPRRWG